MTLRESLGGDVQRIHALVDALLDKEDAILALFDGARVVITRGHGPDPRITTPAEAYANGEPAEKLPHALMCFALWCSGLLIGAGRDPSNFLMKAPLSATGDVDTDRPVSVIQGSVPAGACGLQEDWPTLWPKYRLAIYDAYTIVEQRSAVANFANRCIEELEARLHTLWPGLPDLTPPADDLPAEEPARPPAVGEISFGDLWRLNPIGRASCRERVFRVV